MNPLINTTAETTSTLVNTPPPLHLKHLALYMVPYEPFDGPYVPNTDAKYLSIGLGQWRQPGELAEFSAKVWRFVEGKWSRMSEELPVHRVADLCGFMARCFFGATPQGTVLLPTGSFENQANQMEARFLGRDENTFAGTLPEERMRTRLRALRDLLNSLPL
jgi:Family of unknown function (DUF6530)